jgi:N-acetylmuramoyl-L-alanine amidase
METMLICLALNIFWEARNQDIIGQLAVGQVVMNRVADKRYPDTPCKVIMQGPVYKSGYPVRHRCQFSWYCDGKSDKAREGRAFKQAYFLAQIVIGGQYADVTEGATHYHADYVLPDWIESKTFTTQIGDHLFYRWETR